MQLLGMTGGKFQVEVSPHESAEPQPHGLDQIEFRVTANPGQPLRPLAKVASGGELSRLSLAVQVACTADERRCMVFDEVDAGIGGAVAEVVGRQLRSLGSRSQVLCVTHLPQVASQGHHHLRVLKLTDGKTTRTTLTELSGQERVQEVARMLGGIPGHRRRRWRTPGKCCRRPRPDSGDTARIRVAPPGPPEGPGPLLLRLLGQPGSGSARRTVGLAAAPVQDHRVIVDVEALRAGDGFLAFLDVLVDELLDLAAVQAHDVVVVVAPVELEHGHAVLEMVPGDQARRLELGQHAVHGGEPDVLVRTQQRLVDVFSRFVPRSAALENLEDLQAGQRDLEPGISAGPCLPIWWAPCGVLCAILQ